MGFLLFHQNTDDSCKGVLLEGEEGLVRFPELAFFRSTLPKTNMEPENHLFEKENHLPNLHFRVPC